MPRIAVTRRKKLIEFQGTRYHFILLSPEQFFGFRREMLGGLPIVIADEEKTIIDSLSKPWHAGGVSEVAKALKNAVDVLDVPTLVEYANRMGNSSLCARLGFLLELLGKNPRGLEISKGPVALDPKKARKGEYNHHWRVYVNLSPVELFPEGVA